MFAYLFLVPDQILMTEDMEKPPQCGFKFAGAPSGNRGSDDAYCNFLGLDVRTLSKIH